MTILLYLVAATLFLLAIFAGFNLSMLQMEEKAGWQKLLLIWIFLALLGSAFVVLYVAKLNLLTF